MVVKLLLVAALLVGFCGHAALGQGAQADMIKRRAKDLSNQNNASQGSAPATPPKPAAAASPSATKPAPAAPLTPQQSAAARIRNALAALGKSGVVTNQQTLTRELLAAGRGSTKPFGSSVAKLSESLAAAMAQATALTAADQQRLAQNLEALVNSGSLPATQTDAIADDLSKVLQAGGAQRSAAAATARAAKAVAAEQRQPAKN